MNEQYNYPVYWDLPDDGALFKCVACNKYGKHSEIFLTQVPLNNKRGVMHKSCIDDDWLELAQYKGMYNS